MHTGMCICRNAYMLFKILVSHTNFSVKHTSLPQTLSEMTLNKAPRVQIRRYNTSLTPRRMQVHWIYCFLKQCSRKHKLQETFMVSHASWRRHSTFDLWTVKTTAGIYKGEEKGASLPQWKLADGGGLLLKHTKFISVLFLLRSINNNLI